MRVEDLLLADKVGYPGLRWPVVLRVEGALDPGRCADLRVRIDQGHPEIAPITTASGFELRPEIRNNERVIFDDPALAEELYTSLRPALPEVLLDELRQPIRVVGLNERFRGYRYAPGQRFGPHYDGAYAKDERERSELTVLYYLNEGCVGGETNFLDLGLTVTPRLGQALIFTHQVLHEGARVTEGHKYVLRSDVMYRR